MIKIIIGFIILFIAGISCAYLFIYLPLSLTVGNIRYLRNGQRSEDILRKQFPRELLVLVLGTAYSYVYMGLDFADIRFQDDWFVPIRGIGQHSPIFSEALLTIAVLAILGIISYLGLRLFETKLSQKVKVLLAAGVGLGIIVNALWIIQIIPHSRVLVILPLNIIVIGLATIRDTIPKTVYKRVGIMLIPLYLGLSMLLMVGGQKPQNIITAWTQTSDWTFSMKQSPQ